MDGEKHDLAHEFPEFRDQIHQLKADDAHFAKLLAQYDEADHEIRRSETGVEPRCDEHLSALKQRRLALKDDLHQILKGALVEA